ncbi:hypothetical protein DM01DRAFT_1384268 [Hesseltinella vesiculosa]|uniref:Cyclin N-terminal domain-containing protein n=1 Tax=Hesseltinella vesiculosa TaxID=101127 RepID=A0A1X2GEP0_9FUNG|nr:hypothetical protein DM01DRAFT_1384268 [Hesseltinella vesiculosa]
MKVKLHSCRVKGNVDVFQMHRSPFHCQFTDACQLLQVVKSNAGQPLSETCIAHLATYVTQSWENDASEAKVQDTKTFIHHLLDSTGLPTQDTSTDQVIESFCKRSSAFPVVSPSITLLIAMQYIDRLKMKYKAVHGTPGCSRRMILVAYVLATKFLHASLSSIVCSQASPYAAQPKDLPSPPVSPKYQQELTNPNQYHYFKKTSKDNDKTAQTELSDLCSHFNYRMWRMENEFVQFLDNDLQVRQPKVLLAWSDSL